MDRLIVALDHEDVDEARRCVRRLAGRAQRFKVGSVLFSRGGPSVVRELVEDGHDVFLDLKFHDTPTTVGRAVAAVSELGVDLLTVHAAGGPGMLAAARDAADAAERPPRIVAVTVLTSLDATTHRRISGPAARPLEETAIALARLAREEGMDGVVCSPLEAADLREALGPGALLVVPGIRPAWSVSDHAGQARIATPAEAIAAGADYLVVGRAITAAADPAEAARRIVEEIEAGAEERR